MNPLSFTAAACLAATLLLGACSDRASQSQLDSVQQLIDKRDFKTAIVTLKGAIQKEPGSAQLRYLLGKVLLESGDPSASLVELNKARELGHPDSQTLPPLVKVMMILGQSKDALERYAATQLDSPAAQSELLVSLAMAYTATARYQDARAAVVRALQLDPKNADARVMEAHYLAGEGKGDAAWTMIEAAIKDTPKSASAWYLRGMLQRYVKSDVAGAMQSQRKALELEPRSLLSHTELLSMLYDANDRKGMREQLAAMQAALPANLNTLLFRAELEYLDGNLKGSRDILQQLMRSKIKSHRVLFLAAQIEVRLGSLALAETYLTNALQLRPNYTGARHLLASVHSRQGNNEKALQLLQPLLEVPRPDPTTLALAAEALLQSGNLAKAQSYFDQAHKAKPDDQRLKAAVAMSRMAQGQFEQGVSELEAVAKDDKDSFADLALISAQLRRGNTKEALRAVDRLQSKQPDKPLAAHLRGQIQLLNKDEAAARSSFAAALKVDPVYYPSAAALAALELAAKRIDLAKGHFEELLKRNPGHLNSLLALADLKRRNQEAPEAVTAVLTEAVAKNPTEIAGRVALAEHLLYLKSAKQAASAAQEGLAVLPDAAPLLDVLGRAQLQLQEYQQALITFRKIATAFPTSAQPHLRIAEVHLAQRDLSSARQSYRRALEASPKLLVAQVKLVEIALAEGNLKDALGAAKEIQKSQPNEGAGYLLEGKVQLERKDNSAATAAFRTSLAKRPSTEGAIGFHRALTASGDKAAADKHAANWRATNPKDAAFLLYLGGAAAQARDWVQAEARYREALALAPDELEANNNLAWALMKQGKTGAVPYAEKASRLAPNSPGVMDTHANALVVDGKAAEGLKLAEKALKADANLNEARLTLAKAAIQLGDKARAKKELEELLYLGDKFADQAEVAQLLRGLN